MHEVARAGGGMSAASAIHINIFGPHPIVVFGTEEQRRRFLPELIEGRAKTCFAVTEPDAGLETTAITTRAERQPDGGYIVHGRKIWTTTAQEADRIMLLARTTPRAETGKATKGLSLFYTTLDRSKVEVRRIPKMGRAAVDSNELFIDGLEVPAEDRIGEEGRGFEYILHSLNPERILIGIEAVGVGRNALERAADYARERRVFGRPIGRNQSIQHPLAECWMELEAAFLMAMQAASLYDRDEPCGHYANAAKYLGAEAGFKACTQAVMTHGGMGYVEETGASQYCRDVRIAAIYEGTNGIQGIDLVGRKLPVRGGAVVHELLDRVEATADQLHPDLAALREPLISSSEAARACTDWLLGNPGDAALAGAAPYLRLLAGVVGAWLLARSAEAARTEIAAGATGAEADALGAKQVTAEFFCGQLLPQAAALAPAVTGGSEILAALSASQLR